MEAKNKRHVHKAKNEKHQKLETNKPRNMSSNRELVTQVVYNKIVCS